MGGLADRGPGSCLPMASIRALVLTVAASLAFVLLGSATALADDPPNPGPFGPFAGISLDPLGMATPEDVPVVDQPNWSRAPVFNAYFGSGMLPSGRGIESVALGQDSAGAPLLYVSSARTNQVYIFDGNSTSLAPRGSFGGGSGPAALSDPAGVATWHGDVYVVDRSRSDPQSARVVVFSSTGAYKRQFPLINPLGVADMTGIDVSSGEAWVTGEVCGGFGGVVEIFDSQTGAVKGITGQLAHAPTGDPTVPCDESYDASAWWDLATVPELDSAVTQYRLLRRGLVAAFTTLDPEATCYFCNRRLWQDGLDAVWGMRWLLAVDGDSRTARGTGVTEYSFEPDPTTGNPELQQRRRWFPQQASMGGVRDIAYLNRPVRIDWSGRLTEPKWINGGQSLHYVVSDADIYAVGDRGEAWYELARNFSRVDLAVDGSTLTSSTQPVGDLTIDTNAIPTGVHTLTLTAYLADGRQVVATNSQLRIDHESPTGSLDNPGRFVKGVVHVTGTLADSHAGPRDWTFQALPSGGSQTDVCRAAAADVGSDRWSCDWPTNSGGFPDGTYTIQASLRDLVDSQGPNAATSNGYTVGVDNTPPALQLSGDLYDDSDHGAIAIDETDPLAIQVQDGGAGATAVSVSVDGVDAYSRSQECPGGGCELVGNYGFVASQFTPGQHTVGVIARDGVGNTAQSSWTVVVEDTTPGDTQDPGEAASSVDYECSTDNGCDPSGGSSSAAVQRLAIPLAAPTPMAPVSTSSAYSETSGTVPTSFLACTSANQPLNFAAYSAGSQFGSFALTRIGRTCSVPDPVVDPWPTNYVSYIYGDCTPAPDQPCDPPLEIQSWPSCERNLSQYTVGPGDPGVDPDTPVPHTMTTIDGVPAAVFQDGLQIELYTGRTTVDVYGTDAALVSSAAHALEPAPTVPASPVPASPLTPPPLPAPVAGAMQGLLGCTT